MGQPTKVPSGVSAPNMGQPARTRSHGQTFAELANEFLAIKSRESTTGSYLRYKSVISRLLRDFGETESVLAISSDVLGAHFSERAKQASPGSLGLEISVLKHMFSLALEKGWALKNPAEALKTPRRPSTSVKTLTKAEFARLWRGSPIWIRPCLILAVSCGLRRGEILALRAEDIDIVERCITVRHRGNRIRKVPLGNSVISVLESLKGAVRKSTELLFSEAQMTAGNLSQTFLRALRSVGIDGLSFDDLRYTGAYWLLKKGASLRTVAEFLGHRGLRMVEKLNVETARSLPDLISSIDESLPTVFKTLD